MQPSGSNEFCASSKVSAGCCGSQAATSSVQTMVASCRCADQRRPAGSGAAAELRRAQRACWGGRELRPARGTTMVRVDCASLEESGGGPETGGFPTHAVHWIRSRNRFLHATQFLVVFPSLLINFLATSDFCLRGILVNAMDTS